MSKYPIDLIFRGWLFVNDNELEWMQKSWSNATAGLMPAMASLMFFLWQLWHMSLVPNTGG